LELKNTHRMANVLNRLARRTFSFNLIGERLLFLTLILACFPFTSPGFFIGALSSDLQPWASAAAVCSLACFTIGGVLRQDLKIRRDTFEVTLVAAIPIFYFLLVSLASGQFFTRQTYSWTSLVLFAVVGFTMMAVVVEKIVFWATAIWALVGLIQITLHREFLNWCVYRMHSSGDRGFTSLAVEPSIYGNHILLLACAYLLARQKNSKSEARDSLFALMVLIQLWFISQAMSALIFGFIIVGILVLIMTRYRFFKISLLLLGIYWAATGFNFSVSGRRGDLFNKVGSIELMLRDQSAQDRVGNIAYPLIIFAQEFPWAFGYGPSDQELETLRLKYQNRQLLGESFPVGRLSSGWGTVLFQLGTPGFLWALIFGFVCLTQATISVSLAGFGFMVLMWTAIPWASPLVGVIFGLLFKRSYFRINGSVQ
jgi:hypothetical protein